MTEYTALGGFIKPTVTEDDDIWGDYWNTNADNFDAWFFAVQTVNISAGSGGSHTLTDGEQKARAIVLTGALTGNVTVNSPEAKKRAYIIRNDTTGDYRVAFGPVNGTPITIRQGQTATVVIDGSTAKQADTQQAALLTSSYTAAKTLDANHGGRLVQVDATTASFDLTLPAISATGVGVGYFVTVVRTDATEDRSVTVKPSGTDTIDGGTSYILSRQYQSATLMAMASGKWMIYGAPERFPTPDLFSTRRGNIVQAHRFNEEYVSGGPAFGFRNRAINGLCRVATRNGGQSINLTSAWQHSPVNRWDVGAVGTVSGGTIRQQQTTSFGWANTALLVQNVSNSSAAGEVLARYRFAPEEVIDMEADRCTVGVTVAHDVGASINYQIVVRTCNTKGVFTSMTTLLTSNHAVAGTTQTIYFYNFEATNFERGAEVEIRAQHGAVSSKNFWFTDLILERGANLSVPEIRPLTVDQQLVRAWYDTSYLTAAKPGTTAAWAGSVRANTGIADTNHQPVQFGVTMARPPTIYIYSPFSGATGMAYVFLDDTGGAAGDIAVLVEDIDVKGFQVKLSSARQRPSYHWVADAEWTP